MGVSGWDLCCCALVVQEVLWKQNRKNKQIKFHLTCWRIPCKNSIKKWHVPDKIYSMLWCAPLFFFCRTRQRRVWGENKLSLKLSWIALMLDWLSTEIQTKNVSNRFQGIAKKRKIFLFLFINEMKIRSSVRCRKYL